MRVHEYKSKYEVVQIYIYTTFKCIKFLIVRCNHSDHEYIIYDGSGKYERKYIYNLNSPNQLPPIIIDKDNKNKILTKTQSRSKLNLAEQDQLIGMTFNGDVQNEGLDISLQILLKLK